MLEIGCALGFFLEEAKKDFEVHGVELSEYASRYARKNLKLDVITGALEKANFPKHFFDVVVMWDVIEHLKNARFLLLNVREIIKEDGLLAFSTLDAGSLYAQLLGEKWHLYDNPEHLIYYDKRTIRELLNSTGFDIKIIKSSGNQYSLGYVIYRLAAMYNSRIFSKILKILEKLSINNLTIYINLGDLMTVYAKPILKKEWVDCGKFKA